MNDFRRGHILDAEAKRSPPKPDMIPRLSVIVRLVLILLAFAAPAAADASAEPTTNISHKELTKRLREIAPVVYYGGVMVASGDTMRGPILVVDGALDIQDGGVLTGDAWVVGGRLIMTGQSVVSGRVYLVDSEAFQSRLAMIGGDVSRFRCECRLDADEYEESGTLKFEKYEDPMAIRTKPTVKVGCPSRVQYTVLRIGVERKNPRRPDPYTSGYALVDLPFWSSTHGHFGFDAGAKIPLRGHRIGLLLRAYKRVISNDYWQVSRRENAFILVMSGYEFADYYERRGGDLGLSFMLTGRWDLTVLGSMGKDYSLETGKAPSLFNSNERLPPNPPVNDGNRVAVSAAIQYDSREEPEWPGESWFLRLWGEKGFDAGYGDFNYEAASIELNRYQPLPYDMHLSFRGRLFTTYGGAPMQVYQSLNGYGGVRGLSDQPFDARRGNRLALFSVEWRRRLPDLRFVRAFFTRWDLLVFSDVGLLVEESAEDEPFAFLETPFEDWGKTLGLGVSAESILPYVGIYVAKDLDGDRGMRGIFRIERSF